MMNGQILVCLAHVILHATSSQALLWGQRIFPDDIDLPLTNQRQGLFVSNNHDETAKNIKICETQECKTVATEFLNGMNQSADPCEDFYEFSCGGWATNMPIPQSSAYWNRDTLYQDLVYYRLKEILEIEPNSNDILPVKQAKRWYHSCMDTETLRKKGIKRISSTVMQAGGWPMVMEDEELNAEQYPWQTIDRHYAHLMGFHAFYDVDTHPPMEVREFRAIRIGPPKLLLKRDSMIKQKWYIDLILTVVEMFLQNDKTEVLMERIKKEAEDLVKFESDLHTLLALTEWGFNITDGEFLTWTETDMYLEEFVEWYEEEESIAKFSNDPKAKIDWMSAIQDVFKLANIKIDPYTPIYANNMEYIRNIAKLLKRTSARTIANYVHWNIIASMLPYASPDVEDYVFKMKNQELGVTESEPRCLKCAKEMKMTYAAAYMFTRDYFTNATESAALNMLKTIQNALEKNIDKSNWLDEDSKTIAKDKLNDMKIFMGVPKWFKNESAIINVYKGLIVRNDYLDNVLSYERYERNRNFRRFKTWDDSEEKLSVSMEPLTLNAEYSMHNMINLPPVNFQTPLFTPDLPDNVNYGLCGFTVGHEMGHGFDDMGIEFGKDGDTSPLSRTVLRGYYQRADCFVDQFRQYYGKPESSTSGWGLEKITEGENIADTTGLQAVFHAYETMNKKNPNGDMKLPGLEEFTDYQLFFISFASAWCGLERPEYLKQQKSKGDSHSPARLRVIGAVSNTKDFARVFNCPSGSSMNPTNKCNIWEKPGATPKAAIASWMNKKNYQWDEGW